jgi:hypothetical protein
MTVEEAYQDYVVLRLQGFNEQEALADLSKYVHAITLARLKAHLSTLQPAQSRPRLAK